MVRWGDRPRLFQQAPAPAVTRRRVLAIVAIASLLLTLGTLTACGGGDPDLVLAKGRSLELHVFKPEIVEKVSFVDGEGRHRVVRPRASNRQLALVNVTVVNRTSTVAPLLIDTDAAQLGDRRGERIGALDPFEAAATASTVDPDEGKYSPLLWGQVELGRQFQVVGWIIFDVPKGLTLGTLWWREIDEVTADFVPYYR